MRNWGKLNQGGNEGRVLDVFISGLGAGDYGSWRHSAFEFVSGSYEPGENKQQGHKRWRWKHDTSRQVIGVLGSLTELNWNARDVAVEPIDVPGEYSVMPRLGTVQGDKELPGGSGFPWQDRHGIVAALSLWLDAIGLKLAEPMQRIKRLSRPVLGIFKNAGRPKDLKAPSPPRSDDGDPPWQLRVKPEGRRLGPAHVGTTGGTLRGFHPTGGRGLAAPLRRFSRPTAWS